MREPDDLEAADFLAKIDTMTANGDKHPGATIVRELLDYLHDVADMEEPELDAAYFENQLWLLWHAGMVRGGEVIK